jgi:hypothetical protein
MNKIKLLMKYYEQEMNEVFQTSADYKMTTAKKGFEERHEEATIRAEMLKEMIEAEGGKI